MKLPHRPDNTKIRVAYVVYRFEMGGLERCVARLVNGLDRDRFEPMVVCLERNGNAAEWIADGSTTIIALNKRPGNGVRIVRKLARELRDQSIDVVHSHNWGTLVETTLARRWAGVPIHVHAERGMELDAMQSVPWRRQLRRLATRWSLARVDGFVTNADAIRRRLEQECGSFKCSVEVIPNGVEVPGIDKRLPAGRVLRTALGIPETARVIGSVGRLVAVKDYRMVIDAVARLNRSGRECHLLLLGEGPLADTLAQHAEECGATGRVHFAGRQASVGNWLQAMDVYVNCSVNEGMSQSIVEAMAAGLPLVVTDVGDSAALVNGTAACGTVVPAGSAAALAAAIDRLLRDGERCEQFRRNATARHAARYSEEKMIRRYEALYERLVES